MDRGVVAAAFPRLAQSLGLDGTQGAVVSSTMAGSPAAQAGLQQAM
jgi:S1-C subfamily serine protease